MKQAEGVVVKHRDTHSEFIRNSMSNGRPPNLIIVLDTHSDTFSGQLQATGGLTGLSTSPILPDLVRTYVGETMLQEMAEASAVARAYNVIHEICPGVSPWADITPKVRGGWRVIVMVSSGSAVRQSVHWDYITQLFTQYVLPLRPLQMLTGFIASAWTFSSGLVGTRQCLMMSNHSLMGFWKGLPSMAWRIFGRQYVILSLPTLPPSRQTRSLPPMQPVKGSSLEQLQCTEPNGHWGTTFPGVVHRIAQVGTDRDISLGS
jgi:hypothetical protein